MHRTRQSQSQRTGWLHKRGGRIQTWHKRWFVLTGDLLFYYKSPQDSRPTGTIPLAGNDVIRHQDDSRQLHSCKFEIVAGSGRNYITSTHDSYMISAETAEEADGWVAAIKRVLHEPYGGGMFGRTLEETMAVEARLGGKYIPILIHRCAKFILEHGVNETGIFRLPGQTSRVQALKETYDHGSQLEIPASEDVHTVASLLKLYLRELPEPVIPFNLFDNALKITKFIDNNKKEGLEEIEKLLNHLPKANYNVLKYLCRFLYEIAEHSAQNRMSYANLATVFGPNIMRPQSPNPQNLIESSNASANFFCAMIRSQEQLFPVTVDERPPKRLSIVNPTDIAEYVAFNKTNSKPGGSMFVKSVSPKPYNRTRLGSVPTRLVSPPGEMEKKRGKAKFSGLESPRRTKKFAAFSVFDAGSSSSLDTRDTRSGRVSPLIMSPVIAQFDDDDDQSPPIVHKKDILSPEPHCESEDSRTRAETSETISPDLLVNSIAKEMESLDRQLQVLRNALSKKRKEVRLWKSRCSQERRARLAAEEKIADLQSLVDQTFQQFALDDSEDEDFDDESLSGDSLQESSFNGLLPVNEDHSAPGPLHSNSHGMVSNLPSYMTHTRSNSTQ